MAGKKSATTFRKTARKQSPPKPARMAMAEGRPAVEAWLACVKPELQPLARRLDELIMEAMPNAACAVKWGVPFYGLAGQGWIAGINSFKAHVKLLFFSGSKLKPKLPAGQGSNAIDFHSNDELRLAEKQAKAWLQQAKKIPGWKLKNFPT